MEGARFWFNGLVQAFAVADGDRESVGIRVVRKRSDALAPALGDRPGGVVRL